MRETDIDPDDLDRPDWNSLLQNYDKHDIGEAYFTGRVEQMGLQPENWGIDMRHHDDGLVFDDKMDLRLWKPLDEQESAPSNVSDDTVPMYAERELVDNDPELARVARDECLNIPDHRLTFERWQLKALVDVKTKSNADWMGKFNLRHLAHYARWADVASCPTVVYMTMVNPEHERVGEQNALIPVTTDWDYHALCDHYDPEQVVTHKYGDIKDIARECDIIERVFRAPDGNLVVDIDDDYKYDFDWFAEQVQ